MIEIIRNNSINLGIESLIHGFLPRMTFLHPACHSREVVPLKVKRNLRVSYAANNGSLKIR